MKRRHALAAIVLVLALLVAWRLFDTARPSIESPHMEATGEPSHAALLDGADDTPSALDVATEESRSLASTIDDAIPNEAKHSPVPQAQQFGVLVGHLYDSRYQTLGKHLLVLRNIPCGDESASMPAYRRLVAYTDRDGSFRFKKVPVGDWWVFYGGGSKISTQALRPILDRPIRIEANQTSSEELVLADAHSIHGTLVFDAMEGYSIVVLLASEFTPETPMLEFHIANIPDQEDNGRFEIPIIEPGDYRLTYCTHTVDPRQRICVSERITVGHEDLVLPPKSISDATFGLVVIEMKPVERHK